jgi:cobalt-zinc-cadmium resistance protein CzcA
MNALSALVLASLRQRPLVLGAALAILGAGLWAVGAIPIDAYPDISTPQVQVIVKAPGMSPPEVEQRVTYPLEIEARGIPRQTMLRSVTKNALAVVTIDFEEGTDIYWARQQVAERTGQLLAKLPSGVEGGLAPITTPLSDIYMFLVEGTGTSLMELRAALDYVIRPRLLSVEGVADVNALGGEVRAFQVRPRPRRLVAYGLAMRDLARALMANNSNTGGDRLVRNDQVLWVRSVGQLRTVEDIGSVTVATRNRTPVRVADVAEVTVGPMTRYGAVTRDGKGEGVQGVVLLRRGGNSRKTVEGVKAALDALRPSLPAGVRVEAFYDRSELTSQAVWTVEKALAEAVALVLIVLLLFLGHLRSALTVGLMLPLAVLGTFLVLWGLGLSANLMSLGGLAIAIGLLVDSAIVVVENIQRRLGGSRDGADRAGVVLGAVREVAQPVVAGIAIIVASFLPILSLTGLEGKLFAPLAITISLALFLSLLLSLTVVPALASLLMREHPERESAVVRGLLRWYRPVLGFGLRRRVLTVGLAALGLAGAAAAFPFLGREFLPTLDEGTTVVQVEKMPGISLRQSRRQDGEIQRALLALPEVSRVVSRVGADELGLDPMGFHQTDSFLVTRPRSEWPEPRREALLKRLRQVLDGFLGVSYGFTQPIDMRVSEMLTGVRAAVAVKLFGDDVELLDQKAREIEAVLRRTSGSEGVLLSPLGGQRYLQIALDQRRMSRAGVTAEDVNDLVGLAAAGRTVTEVFEGFRRTPVVVRLPESARGSAEAIGNLVVEGAGGAQLRLGDLTHITEIDGPMQITREQGRRQVTVQANVRGRDMVGFVEEVRDQLAQKVPLPAGYTLQFGGQFESQARASRTLALVVPATLGLIFVLLLVSLGSARHAAIILANIPFAMVGGVVLLLASGLYLSVPASVGFIALLGIAVLNGLVLVTHFNDLRAEGVPLDEAVRQGAERRLRPVLTTAVTALLGLVPLLVATGPGSEIQLPLAVVVVGGIFSSTVLTLVLLPIIYASVEGWVERRPGHRRPR